MKFTTIFCFLLTVVFVSCSPKLNMQFQRTGLVQCLEHDRMTIHLSSEARAETVGKAAGFAERNAIENLLFKGVPKSNQERALIDDEQKVRREFPGFYNDFIVNRGFANFIMSSSIVENYDSGGVYQVVVHMQMDLNNLKKELEKRGIIKSFGL